MTNPNFIPSLQEINELFLSEKGIKLYLLRTDLYHPLISGNKFYKLKYNLEEARKQKKEAILTFGGAFSNHIAATAFAGKEDGFKTIGIIRGEEIRELSSTLQQAKKDGMQLEFVSREFYRNKEALLNYVSEKYGNECYIIPEGGANALGIKGCMEITENINMTFDFICAPCGTGTTLTGIINTLKPNQNAIGFQILKAEKYIETEIEKWMNELQIENKPNWQINENYHLGGYAKITEELKTFVKTFYLQHHIQLDYVYTGKMIFGIYDLIKAGKIKNDTSIIAIHTGGVQGNKGFE